MQKRFITLLVGMALIPAVSYSQVSTEDFAQVMQIAGEKGQALEGDQLGVDINGDLPVEDQLKEAVKSINLDDAVTIPIRSLKAVLSDGEINYISDNGRYILKGELIDVWNYQILSNLDLIKDSVNRLNLNKLGKPVTSLNAVTLPSKNKESKEVVAFIGTQSQSSKLLIKQARKLTNKYSFQFIPVPASGAQEAVLTRQIACAKDGQDILSAIEKNEVQKLQRKDDCDLSAHTETLIAADLMGVTGVPFIVAPNGIVSRGLPESLDSWIKENLI